MWNREQYKEDPPWSEGSSSYAAASGPAVMMRKTRTPDVNEISTSGSAPNKSYFGKAYVWLVGFTAAIGGFLFGYDTGIIGGAMPALEAYFGMDEAQLGFSVSVVFIGSIIGALFGGYFSDRLGRRRVLFATALIFFLSAILTAIPQTITQFNVARFIGGVGIGISIPIAGVYLAEIAPARFRGRIVSLNQLVITFGILVSYVVGGYVAGLGSEAWQISTSWRWAFGTEALPALIFAVVLVLIPESPRWLIQQGRTEEALAVLTRVDGQAAAAAEIEEIKRVIDAEDVSFSQLLKPGLRTALFIGIMLALFDQITGINIVIYYIQKILLELGFSAAEAKLGMLLLGLVNFLTTILALALLDRVGRKSVVAWIGAEMEFALSQAVASGDTFEHRPSECGHCVQDFLADLDLRDLPGEAAGSESGADDALPPADLRFYPAALVVPCGRLPGHAAVAADLGNMAIPNGWIPRRLRSDHCVLRRRYNHIQSLPIPFPQQIPCGRSIIGAVRQKARDRGIELIQEPG